MEGLQAMQRPAQAFGPRAQFRQAQLVLPGQACLPGVNGGDAGSGTRPTRRGLLRQSGAGNGLRPLITATTAQRRAAHLRVHRTQPLGAASARWRR